MDSSPDLNQIRAAIARDPGNAELRYLLGAELAQQKEYDAAVVEMSTALQMDPQLHYARFQLGLLYLTMAQPAQSIATWAPLESLDEQAALKYFKHGLEALIRDDFESCVRLLRQGIALNTQNAPLNHDMTLIIDRVGEAMAPAAAPPAAQAPTLVKVATPEAPTAKESAVRTDFSLYGDPGKTRH